jgi:hypothetical protein
VSALGRERAVALVDGERGSAASTRGRPRDQLDQRVGLGETGPPASIGPRGTAPESLLDARIVRPLREEPVGLGAQLVAALTCAATRIR